MATANWNDVTQPDNHLQPEKSEFTPCKKDCGCRHTESVIQMQQKICIERNVSHTPYLDDPSCRMETTVCHPDHVPTNSVKTAQHKASENGFKKTERKSTDFILFVKELMTIKDKQIEELSDIFHRHQEEVEKLKMSEKPRDDIEVEIMELRISHLKGKFFNHKSLMDNATRILDKLMTGYEKQVSNLDTCKLHYQNCLDTFHLLNNINEGNLDSIGFKIMLLASMNKIKLLATKNVGMTVSLSATESRPVKRGQEGRYQQTENSLRLDVGVMSQIVSEVIPATRYQSIQQLRSEASGRSRLQNSDGGATLTHAEASQQNSPEHCPICLEPVNKKSFTNSCIHSFCFCCLKQWSKVKAECPMCRCLFTGIIHNIRADDSYNISKV